MEIIKEPPKTKYKQKCKYCKCEYIYQRKDEYVDELNLLISKYTVCPYCRNRNYIIFRKKYYGKERYDKDN